MVLGSDHHPDQQTRAEPIRFDELAGPQGADAAGQTRCDLSLQTIKRVLEETADALSKIAPDVVTYFKNRATHRDIGDRLLAAWRQAFNTVSGLPTAQSQKPARPDSYHRERRKTQCHVPALVSLGTSGTFLEIDRSERGALG